MHETAKGENKDFRLLAEHRGSTHTTCWAHVKIYYPMEPSAGKVLCSSVGVLLILSDNGFIKSVSEDIYVLCT